MIGGRGNARVSGKSVSVDATPVLPFTEKQEAGRRRGKKFSNISGNIIEMARTFVTYYKNFLSFALLFN